MQEHSSIFISYRRTDVEFVKQLDQALREGGRDVWVDWEDIPPASTDFKDDIIRGIQEADVFVAVLSPDYLESTYCVDLELGYALELQKRIIPVVYRKFDDKPIPQGIGHINWVFFTPHAGQRNAFEQAFPRLVAAIDVDLAHTRTHTRLTVQAKEWDKNGRHNSYLLDGVQIEAADAWLAEATTKQPHATELLVDFINTSRRVESEEQQLKLQLQRRSINRLRYLAGVFILFAVVTAGLLVVIINLNQQVEAQRIAANRELVTENMQSGNYQAALSYANVGLDTYNDTSVLDERGEANLALGNHGAARDDFNRAIEADPTNAALYNLRGQAYAGMGQHAAAIADYEQALQLDPTLVDAYNNRGLSHEAEGRWDTAYMDLTEALRLEPIAEYYVHRGRISRQLGDWQVAIDDFDEALRLDPRFPDANFERGRTQAARGNYLEAIRDYTRAITDRTEFAEALYYRALSFANIGASDFAFIDYGIATTIEPTYGSEEALGQLWAALNDGGYTAQSTSSDTGEQATYVVQPYDNIFTLSVRFGTSEEAIIAANDLEDPNALFVGQELVIP